MDYSHKWNFDELQNFVFDIFSLGTAKLILGDALKEGTKLSINPLVLWAWAGLLINAINSIPAGELDGGRIAFAMWGRKVKKSCCYCKFVSIDVTTGWLPEAGKNCNLSSLT